MKSKAFYQLMNLSKTGVETPVLSAPGIPVDLFELKREAVAYAEEYPELIRHGRFTVKPIMVLQEADTEEEAPTTTTVVEE